MSIEKIVNKILPTAVAAAALTKTVTNLSDMKFINNEFLPGISAVSGLKLGPIPNLSDLAKNAMGSVSDMFGSAKDAVGNMFGSSKSDIIKEDAIHTLDESVGMAASPESICCNTIPVDEAVKTTGDSFGGNFAAAATKSTFLDSNLLPELPDNLKTIEPQSFGDLGSDYDSAPEGYNPSYEGEWTEPSFGELGSDYDSPSWDENAYEAPPEGYNPSYEGEWYEDDFSMLGSDYEAPPPDFSELGSDYETPPWDADAYEASPNCIGNSIDSGEESITDFDSPSGGGSMPTGSSLYVIGKPVGFNESIDPGGRLSNYIKSKMSVIDLIPCDYKLDFTKMKEQSMEGGNPVGDGLYTIKYDEKVKIYQRLQRHYGLDSGDSAKSGVRLYTTDDTTSVDNFSIQYKPNIFQGPIDKLGDATRSLADFMNSVDSTWQATANKKVSEGIDWLKTKMGNNNATNAAGAFLETAITSIVKGNRVSFPKIWQNTSYNNTLSTVIKLVSPYGHPKAVYEFIIKPLTYLILLASPQTIDGFTYGGSIPLTIKAYGMNHTTLGTISNITARRGGNDTSFNVYRQPLSIDVSITFETLFDGFAAYLPNGSGQGIDEMFSAKDGTLTGQSGPGNELYQKTPRTPLMTVGKVLESLKPIKIVEGNFDTYGSMNRPSRINAPGAGGLGDLNRSLGNISSGVSTATNTVGDFLGMSNLSEFTTAKKSITGVINSVTGWVGERTKDVSVGDAAKEKIFGNMGINLKM